VYLSKNQRTRSVRGKCIGRDDENRIRTRNLYKLTNEYRVAGKRTHYGVPEYARAVIKFNIELTFRHCALDDPRK